MKPQRTVRQPQPESPTALLKSSNPEDLRWQVQPVQLALARRAYELFVMRGHEHGHDWEDWFRAESELLRPVSVSVSETEDRIAVRANVLGFEENEITVSIEPSRLTILGKREMRARGTSGSKPEDSDLYPDQIFQVIELPGEVLPESAVIELQGGLLKFELRKAAKRKVEPAGTAA